MLAGHVPGPGADRIEINSPNTNPRRAFAQTCLVKNHVWSTVPEPFADGMQVTITWSKGDTVLFACESGPLRADALEPMFGPDWTGYAPLDS